MDELTEFDEQADDGRGLARLQEAYLAMLRGRETMGVVDALEMAALSAGATIAECEAAYRECKHLARWKAGAA